MKRYDILYIDHEGNTKEALVYKNDVKSAIRFFIDWKGDKKIIEISETEDKPKSRTRVLNTVETGKY